MKLNFHFIIILIYEINKSYIYAFKFKTHNSGQILNNNHFKNNLNYRFLKEDTNKNSIIINSTKNNLYYINLEVGTPSQIFSVLLDTGSNLFWINNNNCNNCQSKSKFIPEKSTTFNSTNKLIGINYISGTLNGVISSDIIKFNNNKFNSIFNFILINESNINFELDGIFGLSKNIKDFDYKEFSPISQIYNSELYNNNYIIDFPNKNFFIGETPSYLDSYNNFSCKRKSIYNLNDYYWKCISKKIKLNNISFNSQENNIVFNSGLNSIVFSLNYQKYFNNIISQNKLLKEAKCEIKKSEENEQICTIICNNFDNLINSENDVYTKLFKEDFLTVFFEDRHNCIFFKLEDFYDEINQNFNLYFVDIPDNTIMLGIPLFEKYIVMLDKDNDEIIIYDRKKGIKYSEVYNSIWAKIAIFIMVTSIILIIIYYIYYRKKRISLYKLIYQK